MKIQELCEAERPREKMLSMGPTALSNGELLAVLLRTGSAPDSALDLAQKLLSKCGGSLGILFNTSVDTLCSLHGIGPGKAATIQAALELGRRFLSEESSVKRRSIVSSRMVYDMMLPSLKGTPYEECWALFLNGKNYLIGKSLVSKGGSSSTVMDIGKIVRSALEKNASGIILLHNHPAGNPHPSEADIKQTDLLHEACGAVQIDLLDHIIISDDCFFSCADNRMYNK